MKMEMYATFSAARQNVIEHGGSQIKLILCYIVCSYSNAKMAANTLFLFITAEGVTVCGKTYDYRDILTPTDEGHIQLDYWSQAKRKTGDPLLLDENLHTFIFYRMNDKRPFKMVGTVRQRTLLQERTREHPLLVRFIIDPLPQREFMPIPYMGIGKYKLGVFQGMRAEPTISNPTPVGIVPVRMMA
jgi:hypothetical protein